VLLGLVKLPPKPDLRREAFHLFAAPTAEEKAAIMEAWRRRSLWNPTLEIWDPTPSTVKASDRPPPAGWAELENVR
jgi:hypothetical protein